MGSDPKSSTRLRAYFNPKGPSQSQQQLLLSATLLFSLFLLIPLFLPVWTLLPTTIPVLSPTFAVSLDSFAGNALTPPPSLSHEPSVLQIPTTHQDDPMYPPRLGSVPVVNVSSLPSLGAGGGFQPGRFVSGPLDLQVTFLSRATLTGALRREAVRLSFSLLDASLFRVSYYWALTPPSDPAMLKAVLEENATHKDIVWCNPKHADHELTNKVHDEMLWAVDTPNPAPFWVKLDDDVLVLWERFMPILYGSMPREGLVWCAQGRGHGGIYCNGPYLFSMDVVRRLAYDAAACCGGGMVDDLWFPSIVWNNRAMWNFGADSRWHNDDMGDPAECVCKKFTLRSDSVLVHHIHPRLLTFYMTNRTKFALVGKPLRNYDYNVCGEESIADPGCNWVPGCSKESPAPKDCILNEWGAREN